MIHALIALGICVIVFLTKLPAFLMLVIIPFYVAREFAQAEYRYIEQYCGRKREKMPWYAPFTLKAWTVKGVLDFVLPSVVSIICYVITIYWRG